MAPGATARPVQFGTSGWRGVLGDDVDFERLEALARAAAAWLASESPKRPIVVGYDTRFASEAMALRVVAQLAGAGHRAVFADRAGPTPSAVFAVRSRRAAGALVVTASHNPAEYHGLKVFAASGVSLGDREARRIEARVALELRRPSSHADPGFTARRRADLVTPHRRAVLAKLAAGGGRGPRVVVDAMHGVAAASVPALLTAQGARVTALRVDPDPRFGGDLPDPSGSRLALLARTVRKTRGARFGVALDGDADRFGVVDERGRVLRDGQAAALLVDHLARTRRLRAGLVLTSASGSLAERVAHSHGLSAERLPIGFKWLGAALAESRAEIASDESGGFAWSSISYDKDGVAAVALLTETMSQGGLPLSARVAALEREHGRLRSGRTQARIDPGLLAGLERLVATPPGRVGGARVREVVADEGLRVGFDDGFLMWRRSGTEPLVRVYAEALGERALEARLAAGLGVLRRAGRTARVGRPRRIQ